MVLEKLIKDLKEMLETEPDDIKNDAYFYSFSADEIKDIIEVLETK